MLIIKGNPEDCMKIIRGMVERYGNITLKEYLELMKKEVVVLV